MKIKAHALPVKGAMVGGLAADPQRGCVWLGLAGTPQYVWRFDPSSGKFEHEDVDALLAGYSYVHRSIVPAPDGKVYVGGTWLAGVKPGGGKPIPLSPGGFGATLAALRWVGSLLSSCRVICREPDGTWRRVGDGRYMSADLTWDASSGRLLRLSPKGITCLGAGGADSIVAAPMSGFLHELNVGPAGEIVQCDASGGVWVQTEGKAPERVGAIEDHDGASRAAPGIDALMFLPPHHMVGGTRNRARPFVIDLKGRVLTMLPAASTAPRAAAFCPGPPGSAYFASGVGKVALHRLDAAAGGVAPLGAIAADGVPCHHLHDLAAMPDGRLFGGEFFPLDVPEPPWPQRECMLWEIDPGA